MPENLMASTALTPKVLANVSLGTSLASVYAVPAATGTIIRTALVHNSTSASIGLVLAVVMNGGAAVQIGKFNVPPGDTAVLDELQGMNLGPADAIQMSSTVTPGVNATLTGAVNA